MSARVICLSGVKGGSGTTTIVAALGRLLAGAGLRSLLIDADLDGAGLSVMHLDHVLAARAEASSPPCGLAEAARTGCDADACRLTASLALIPAAYAFPGTPCRNVPSLERALARAVHANRPGYDIVLIDAPPIVTATGALVSRLADDLVLVAGYDALSAATLSRLEGRFGDDGSRGRTWVLPNRSDPAADAAVPASLRGYSWLPAVPYYRAVTTAGARRDLPLGDDDPSPFAWCLLRAVGQVDARLPGLVRDQLEWDLDGVGQRWREEYVRARADLNELERRRMRLENALRGDNGGPSTGFRLGVALAVAVAPLSWALALALGGTRPEWRAAAYLLVVVGVALAVWVWRFSDLRAREYGDSVEQLLELDTVRESQRELRHRIRELEPIVLRDAEEPAR